MYFRTAGKLQYHILHNMSVLQKTSQSKNTSMEVKFNKPNQAGTSKQKVRGQSKN